MVFRLKPALLTLGMCLAASHVSGQDQNQGGVLRFTFDSEPIGSAPSGWTAATTSGEAAVGRWEVVAGSEASSETPVVSLLETNHSRRRTYNVLWTDQVPFLDGEVSVRVGAREGVIDQGGGPIWRVQDESNYYISRWNPLENNFRVYVVENARRRQLATASVEIDATAWHEIQIAHHGEQIVCWLDGERLLEAQDATITEAGGVGLWTKADALTAFDDLTVTPEPASGE